MSDIYRYAWVESLAGGFQLVRIGGPSIGRAVLCRLDLDGDRPAWIAYLPGEEVIRSGEQVFDTRTAAGGWLVEQWEARP